MPVRLAEISDLRAIDGLNLGLPLALGKISLGDNMTVLTLIQGFLTELSERATLSTAETVLLRIKLDNEFLDAVVQSLSVQAPTNAATAANSASTHAATSKN